MEERSRWDIRSGQAGRGLSSHFFTRLLSESSLADWPLSYADLEPYYDRIEHEIGVSGKAGNLQGRKVEGGNVFVHLLGPARADESGGHSWIAQDPGEGHLSKALASCARDFIQRADSGQVFLAEMACLQGIAARLFDSRILRHPMQSLAS